MKKQDETPLVSVVLSTHDGRDIWLEKAIDSVYAQTYQNFEFIIINDCSNNDIEKTIEKYRKKCTNMVYIKNDKNLGLANSLNIGIKNSSGKYIARIDDDDYWISKDKLEKQVNFMEENIEYGLCGAGEVVRIDENDKIIFTEHKGFSDEKIRKDMLLWCWITHSSVLIRKKTLDEVGLYDPKYFSEDAELWCRIGTKYKLINLPDVSIAYRVHPDSMRGSKRYKMLKAVFSKIMRKNRNNYPNFLKALFLKIGTLILGKRISSFLWRKINLKSGAVNPGLESDKKNILVLNYEFPPIGGGAAIVSYDLSKGYVDAGYGVDVITMGFKGLSKYENKDGINIYRVKCIRNKKEVCHPYEQLTYLISGYFKAKKLLKQKKYEVCHCHFLVPTGVLAFLLKKKFGLKYFITSHGSDVPGYNPNRFKLLHKFTPRLLKKIINNSESLTTPSKYLSDLIIKNIKGICKMPEIIPNGIDTNRFIPLKKERIILGTGRLWPLKGLHLLAEAFSKIENTKGFELHICGDGPLMGELERIQMKSKNKIILYGWLDNKTKEYSDLLGKAMIYSLPSVSESGSLSILEGMSSECAILTTSMGVCLEMAKDVGLYVEPNVESIKSQLKYLIENDEVCNELGKKARIKAINNYDKNVIIGKYVKLCERYL